MPNLLIFSDLLITQTHLSFYLAQTVHTPIFTSYVGIKLRKFLALSYMEIVATYGPLGYKAFSCPNQLSMKFKLPIKTKCRKINTFLAFKLSDVV